MVKLSSEESDGIGLWRSLVAHLTGGQGVAGSNPVSPTIVMSQDMPDTRTCGSRFGCLSFRGVLGLVVLAGIDDEVADELAGGGVDDADVEVLDEQDHAGAGVGSADADVA